MESLKEHWVYIKSLKIDSLFWRTFLIISALLVVPFTTLGVLFYANTFDTIKAESRLENSSILDSAENVVNNTINECDMMSSYIASNENAQAFMLSKTYTNSIANLSGLAKTIPLIYKYVDSVYIYSEFNNSAFVGERNVPISELDDSEWLDDYKNLDDRRGIIIPREKNNSFPPLITIIKPIYVADEKRGAVIMNINSQKLYRSVVSDRYNSGQEFFLVDNNHCILLSTDTSYFRKQLEDIQLLPDNADITSGLNTYLKNGDNNIILHQNSESFGFTYIGTYETALYADKLTQMKWHIFFISLSLLILCFVLAYIISLKSYTPLREIISFLDKTTPNISYKDSNELIYIVNSIKLHIEDKEKMEEILKERMALLKKSQYEMLQAQINPHFLYNTLETINWMAYKLSNSDNPVSAALVNLASFFRHTLSPSEYLISIEDEIKYTNDYINILDLRYGNLFDIIWDIDKNVLPCTIIKICLQPIIENAVYHGFKPKNSKGLLTITGKCTDTNITIIVQDDGVGMDNDALNKLNARMHEDIYVQNNHIGLTNVNKRIKIIFGDNYGINVESKPGSGTKVYVTIPKDSEV